MAATSPALKQQEMAWCCDPAAHCPTTLLPMQTCLPTPMRCARCLLRARRCPAAAATPATCTPIWPPSTSVQVGLVLPAQGRQSTAGRCTLRWPLHGHVVAAMLRRAVSRDERARSTFRRLVPPPAALPNASTPSPDPLPWPRRAHRGAQGLHHAAAHPDHAQRRHHAPHPRPDGLHHGGAGAHCAAARGAVRWMEGRSEPCSRGGGGCLYSRPYESIRLLLLDAEALFTPHPHPRMHPARPQVYVDRQLHNRQVYPPINVLPSLSRLMKVG